LEAKQFGTRDNKAVPFKWTDHSGCKWLNASMHIEEQHAPTESWPKSQPKGRKKPGKLERRKHTAERQANKVLARPQKGSTFGPVFFLR